LAEVLPTFSVTQLKIVCWTHSAASFRRAYFEKTRPASL
jgi:hypothetical protein